MADIIVICNFSPKKMRPIVKFFGWILPSGSCSFNWMGKFT